MNYFLSRMKEPSTYAGIATLLIVGGLISPDTINQVLYFLSAISGGLSIALKENATR